MKRSVTLVLAAVLCFAPLALAGDLTPPGPPAPTKRTPIRTIPYTIDQPGSYYLTKDLGPADPDTDGIMITADNVTLDLSGFSLVGAGRAVGTTGIGVHAPASARQNIAVFNGTVRNWRGEGVGIDGSMHVVRDIRAHSNGGYGIATSAASLVSRNVCYDNDGYGISVGINSKVLDNVCYGNGQYGISAHEGSTVADNCCHSNGSSGIRAVMTGSTVVNNSCYGNGSQGIDASNAVVADNTCRNNTAEGIRAGDGATIKGNECSGNGVCGIYGIDGSTICDNTCIANTGYGIQARYGALVSGNACYSNTSTGIVVDKGSRVFNNTCYDNDLHGIDTQQDCTVTGNTCSENGVTATSTGDGIRAYADCTVSGNTCADNYGNGINVTLKGGNVFGNTCSDNRLDGVLVVANCRVVDNLCESNGNAGDGAGIHATGSRNAILRNSSTTNDRGLDIDNATNYSSQNTLSGNTTNEDLGGSTEGAGDLANVTF
jgi:hypothetical protein